MKKPVFTGVGTALVTPFLGDRINYPLVERLLKAQLDAKIPAVILSGTTGESPTLSDDEKKELCRRSKAYVGNQCTIIAGTGTNDTSHAIELSCAAEEAGADALLVVSPYYNKGNPDGLYSHYIAIADAVKIPIIIYNVPSRTGVDIPVSVYRSLALHPNINGVKEASTDIAKTLRIRSSCPRDFYVWSGNDDMTVPIVSLGGKGVISVLSNICPGDVAAMTDAALAGDFDTAADLQCLFQPLVELLFSDVNPIPVKYAMQYAGFDCGSCRLPLGKPNEVLKKKLDRYFQ
ncbi:MAG: 4-hydroxy-tetrahydrodipicolinate synthase [Oscillospiraceae bacterium]|nr:4-hydroxy-tetrahydrodipicolinate synthase [Oscillospiraceae bacterium]